MSGDNQTMVKNIVFFIAGMSSFMLYGSHDHRYMLPKEAREWCPRRATEQPLFEMMPVQTPSPEPKAIPSARPYGSLLDPNKPTFSFFGNPIADAVTALY